MFSALRRRINQPLSRWPIRLRLATSVALVAFVLQRTRLGLIVRAIGENHDAAHAIGYPVIAYRYLALMFGGAMAGLGGAYLSLVQTPLWVERMTAGRGWIALALVVFAAWRPWRVLLGAYLFGGITILQLHSQALGVKVDGVHPSALKVILEHQPKPGSRLRPDPAAFASDSATISDGAGDFAKDFPDSQKIGFA